MMRRSILIAARQVLLMSLVVFMVVGAYSAETFAAGPYQISWYTIDGGGGTSTGGPYTLTGTIGQPDAGYSNSDKYELLGGFWPGGPICIVEFDEFAKLAEQWLRTGCDNSNGWCSGADINKDKVVDLLDLDLLVEKWLCECPQGWRLK